MDVAYRTICDPPAPTTATKCRLPFCETECIATASESRLQIYSCDDGELKLIWEKIFWGNIFAVFSHRIGKFDSLILGIDNTKVIVLSPVGGCDLQEVEWHSFDKVEWHDDPIQIRPPECARHPTMMVKDDRNSCIAMLIAGEWLLFLTLCEDSDFARMERPKIQTGQHSAWNIITGATRQSLIDDIAPIFRVRDIKFLDGYNRPTLAIMHEPIPTWSVRLPFQKSTVVVSLLSPLLIQRAKLSRQDNQVKWMSKTLPHNSLCLIPVKPPHGGFIVLTKNAIIYMTHTSGLAYGLNALAKVDDECPFEITDESQKPYEICSSVYSIIDERHIVILLDEHKFGIIKLHDNGVDVTGLSLFVHEELDVHPSLLLYYGNSVMFCGSTVHDSILYRMEPHFETEDSDTFVSDISLSDEEANLYQNLYQTLPTKPAREIITGVEVRELSRIYQLGAVSTACPFVGFGEAANAQGNEDAISMALGCGLKSYGCLHYLRCSVSPSIIDEFRVSGATTAFVSEKFGWILFSTGGSAPLSTLVYRREGGEFTDCTDSVKDMVNIKEITIAAADFGGGFVQVTKGGVRYIFDGNVVDYPFHESEIKQAKLSDEYIILILGTHQVYLCEGVTSDGQLSFTPLVLPEGRRQMKFYKSALYEKVAFLLQDNNALHIYSLTEHTILCSFDHFRYFLDAVHNEGEAPVIAGQPSVVVDMNLMKVGHMVVLALIVKDGNVILYQCLEANDVHGYALKRIKTRKLTSTGKASPSSRIVPFRNVKCGSSTVGVSGAFICSSRPMFLLAESGYPRLVPAPTGAFFTQFHSDFVFGDGTVARIANLDSLSVLETHIIDGCVVQRQYLHRTPRTMTFAPPWRALVVMTSLPEPFVLEYETSIEPEESLTPHYQNPLTPPRELEGDGFPERFEEHYEMYVVTEDSITRVLEMERHEIGMCVAFVRTIDNYQEPEHSAMYEYLVVGCGFLCHEERTMRGRVAIYKGMLVQSEDMTKTEYKLQELMKQNKLLPVTAVCDLAGFILMCYGGKMELNRFLNTEKGWKLDAAAFLGGHFYCKQVISMKNYIFFADMYKGFQVVRWRNYGKKLITMAKDFSTHLPVSGGLLTNGGAFGGVVFDNFGNAQVFEYDEYAIPIDAVLVRSVFHIGCKALSAGNFPVRGVTETGQACVSGHFTWFVSDKGKIGTFSPIKDDAARRRLCVAQTAFEKLLPGLSHLEYRTGKFPMVRNDEQKVSTPRLVVDLDLLFDMLESQPDIQRQCIKSGHNISPDAMTLLKEVYAATNIFE